MNVLVVGSGGREHALAWKVAQSTQVENVYVAPGNAGIARENKLHNIEITADDIQKLAEFAKNNAITLTIIGPEVPLVAGIVDYFNERNLACFGPSQAAAQLEGSKSFSKDFLARHNIPSASYAVFDSLQPALDYLPNQTYPLVIKADGLAAGKGVIIAQTVEEAAQAVRAMLSEQAFGEAGQNIVIEAFLIGEEASFICMVDGEHILPMASSQDHKARDEGDKGPNTGGMGAYSPAPVVTPEIHDRIMNEVIRPTVEGLSAEGTPYTGFLYAGVMVAADGTPNVLEFNCRFGDPETQPIMMRLQSDLVELCQAALAGKLNTVSAQWDERVALGVVLAAGGYPNAYDKHIPIDDLPADTDNSKVFHAGTTEIDGQLCTSGGRVLCACALGDTVSVAQKAAYALVKQIHWDKMYYRGDIGYRAIERES
jgi:phosphoribosylamine--glycine ligase